MAIKAPGSLSKHYNDWVNIGASPKVLKWIQDGVELPFIKTQERFLFNNHKLSAREEKFIDSEISDLEKSGAISRVDYIPHCVSPIGCVAKKGNKLRLIVDLRKLNDNINCPHFKNEDIENVCENIETGDNLITVDLKDGYHHINIHKAYRTYLGICWRNVYYVWNILPFGLNASPRFF